MCKRCNTIGNSCGCNTTPTSSCNPDPCGCKFTVPMPCVIGTLSEMCTIGDVRGLNLEEIIDKLDTYLCELASSILDGFVAINIGEQSEIYKGANNDGVEEFRTLEGTESVDVSQGEDTVSFSVNEVWLNTFIQASTNSIIESIGDAGVDVYKGYNTTTEKHEIRKIKSDTFEVIEDGDSIRINEVSITDNQTFYVNNNYNGVVENGTLSKPYKTINAALTAVTGTGTIESPQFLGARIIVLPSSTTYGFTSNLFIRSLNFEVQQGARLLFTDTTKYMIDTRNIVTHPNYVNTNSYTMNFYNDGLVETLGGLIYAKGNGNLSGNSINVTLYGKGRFAQVFDISNFINIPQTVGGTDYISFGGLETKFYTGDPNQMPMMVCDGDSGDGTNLAIAEDGLSITASTQTLLEIKNKGYFYSLLSSLNLNILQTFAHYGTISGTNGNPTVITPNEDFNMIRIDGEGTFNCKELNFELQRVGNDSYVYYSEVIKLNPSSPQSANIQITGGRIVSAAEFNHIINLYGTFDSGVILTDTELRFGGSSSSLTGRYIINSEEVSSVNAVTFNRNITDKGVDPQIDLTRGNSISPVNVINNNQVISYRKYPSRTAAEVAGVLAGTVFINTNNSDIDTSTHFLDTVI